MTTITSNRGTSTTTDDGLVFGKKSSALPKNESITVNLGTKVVKTADIPNVTKPSLKGQTITVKRGTEVITL
tara:strand:- start:1274 stop:1489 length:216 start_codon:yes stop_codon:yes gene_type:complete